MQHAFNLIPVWIVCISLALPAYLAAQNEEMYFVSVENLPEPIGGMMAIQKKVVYPEIARRAGIQGTVYVEAFINERGEVDRAVVRKGIGSGCDEAAVAAVKQSKFRPGTQQGVPVKVRLAIPIRFRLADKSGAVSSRPPLRFTDKEYADLLALLGIHVGKFRYTVPHPHQLHVEVELYEKGKKARTQSFLQYYQSAGEHVIPVVLWEERGVMRLGLQFDKQLVKGEVPFKIIGPVHHQFFEPTQIPEKEVKPVYVFASHPTVVPDIVGNESLSELIESFEHLLVIKLLYER
jgi:TonB family protein